MPSIGKGAASSVASNVRNSFKNIELALVVGICGAAPLTPSHEEILLGDVVISDGIIQYDLGRRLPHTFIRKDTLLDNLGRPNPRIRSHLAKLRGRRSRVQLQEELILHLTELQERWPDQSLESPGIEQDQLFQSTYHHQHHQTPCSVCATNMIEDCKDRAICQEALHMTCDELVCDPKMAIPRIRHQVALHGDGTLTPRVHYGLIASGDSVIRSGVDRDILVARDGVIAFEMEGAGVWDNLPCIVIKAACDYADSHKNKHWQNYAAATAAACTKAFLQAWVANDSSTTLE
ncbi:nucleoside phosphorylase domain-containing protein [Aspergillus pseudotamarii]|uniref:Nucleoside phosphorylase domain-containing protein n=1 Tax=Aspergillus pseudotamarii TaxID=132259 RepID=A0A5N6SZV4_ASPPS|nr:nucleoside phosphorylase domain-containing protein [Aspergillus pseudotamarii]KAE8140162.1 nucleoside phosphorylase domain-containing protein [Aspergillus pseudotamarii]